MASIVIGFRHIADSIFFHAAVEALWSMRQVCRTWYCRVALEFFHLRDVVLTGEDSTSPGGQIFSFKTRTGRELDTTDTPLWRYCNIADVRPMPSAPEAQPDHPPDAPTSDDAPPPRDAIRTVRRPASAAHHDFKWLGPSRHGNRRNVFDNHFKADYAPAPTMVVVNYRDVGFGVQAVRPASVQWYQPRIFYFVVHGDVTGAPLVWESAAARCASLLDGEIGFNADVRFVYVAPLPPLQLAQLLPGAVWQPLSDYRINCGERQFAVETDFSTPRLS